MESRNPCGSVKDRIGVAMIGFAEKSGRLEPGAEVAFDPVAVSGAFDLVLPVTHEAVCP